MSDVEPAVTADDMLERIACSLLEIVEQLRAMTGDEPSVSRDDSAPNDLMRPGDAVHQFGVPRSTLHRLCREYPLGSPGGFAMFDPHRKRYSVSRSRLAALLRRMGRSGT